MDSQCATLAERIAANEKGTGSLKTEAENLLSLINTVRGEFSAYFTAKQIEEMLDNAETAILNATKARLDEAVNKLNSADIENSDALSAAIADLNKAIADASSIAGAANDSLKNALNVSIHVAIAELEEKINTVSIQVKANEDAIRELQNTNKKLDCALMIVIILFTLCVPFCATVIIINLVKKKLVFKS